MALSDLIPERIKKMDLVTAWRHAKSITIGLIVTWGTFVSFGGWIVESIAQDTFEKLLIENPQFIELKQQLEANVKSQKELKNELDAMGNELGQQIGTVSSQLSIQNATSTRMERDIDRLVDALIPPRRGDLEIPPWPGPVRP